VPRYVIILKDIISYEYIKKKLKESERDVSWISGAYNEYIAYYKKNAHPGDVKKKSWKDRTILILCIKSIWEL